MARLAEKATTFWNRVDVRSEFECWRWKGALTHNGYGRFAPRLDGVLVRWMAHRAAYELTNGQIPDGLVLDHLCRNRDCCNPAHLEPVPHAVNVLRGESQSAENARKSECVDGHPFSIENTYITKRGTRHCRACQNRRSREYAARKAQRRG